MLRSLGSLRLRSVPVLWFAVLAAVVTGFCLVLVSAAIAERAAPRGPMSAQSAPHVETNGTR